VVAYGYVKGNVRATGTIEIKKDGPVIGNSTTAQIMIEDAADFKGTIEIDRSPTKGADKARRRLVRGGLTRNAREGNERVRL
jgi:cytoskeletal protein CcmA (bactofilin family)